MGLKQALPECWQWTSVGAAQHLRCLHPRPVRLLIARVTLTGPGERHVVLDRPPKRRGKAVMAQLAPGEAQPDQACAELDFNEEFASLQAVRPEPGSFANWLRRLHDRPLRWRGLVLAAASADPWLVPPASYERRFLPLLVRHALLHPTDDPALGVMLGFSLRARRLHAWLQSLRGAGSRDLPLLYLGRLEGVGPQERLLALEQLVSRQQVVEPFRPPFSTTKIPLVQYWEGIPTPIDVEAMLQAWPEAYPDFELHRFDAAGAEAWIRNHGDPQDLERFRRCWHPAMQSDFLRVLHVASRGGVYLDCDTPVPTSDDSRRRWWGLVEHCWGSRTLALCVNAIRQPGDLRHYVVNCCLWAPPDHPLMQRWLRAYRKRLDELPAELVGTPTGIHTLGPDLVSELVDDLLRQPGTQASLISWDGIRPLYLNVQDWNLLLLSTPTYHGLFGVRFSCHASYQSCNDPRDWRIGGKL